MKTKKQLYTYTMKDGSSFEFEVIQNDPNKNKVVILTKDPIKMFTITKQELKKARKLND